MRSAWQIASQHPRRVTGLLCLLLFMLAALVSLKSGDALRYPDEKDYHQLAQNLLSGAGYINAESQPTAFRPPGYPLILGCLYHGWPSPLAAKLFNSLALALSAWLISLLVARVVPEGRLFVPLLFLLYPLFLYAGSTLYPQTIGMLLLVAALLCLSQSPSTATAFATAGLLLGFLILTIPSFFLFIPFVAAYPFTVSPQTRSRQFRLVLLGLLCVALVVSPWTLRNALQFKRFLPVSANSGLMLLAGNSENTTARGGITVDISRYQADTEGMDEITRDAFFKRSAFTWIAAHPGRASGLYLRKVAHYFDFRETLFVRSEGSAFRNWLLFFTYYPLLALALVRIALWRRYRFSRPEALLYLFYFGNAFLSALFFTRIRYRIPFDAILIALAALFLGRLRTRPKPVSALSTSL